MVQVYVLYWKLIFKSQCSECAKNGMNMMKEEFFIVPWHKDSNINALSFTTAMVIPQLLSYLGTNRLIMFLLFLITALNYTGFLFAVNKPQTSYSYK